MPISSATVSYAGALLVAAVVTAVVLRRPRRYPVTVIVLVIILVFALVFATAGAEPTAIAAVVGCAGVAAARLGASRGRRI
ncbi:hypothetical protein [Actinoplanes teichomyceticus]|nr:hypothetical protein [Actinoplanes teichomyceticus]